MLPYKDAKTAAEEAKDHTNGLLAVSMWSDRSSLDSGRTVTTVACINNRDHAAGAAAE